MLQIVTLPFAHPDFVRCLAIRLEVFVGEQHVPPEQERDEYDATARHFLALQDAEPIGTARLIFKDAGHTGKISRVAVRRAARGCGIGAALINAIEAAPDCAGIRRFILDAQLQALPFYQGLGYHAVGTAFMEAGIPHRQMAKLREA